MVKADNITTVGLVSWAHAPYTCHAALPSKCFINHSCYNILLLRFVIPELTSDCKVTVSSPVRGIAGDKALGNMHVTIVSLPLFPSLLIVPKISTLGRKSALPRARCALIISETSTYTMGKLEHTHN
jgi:hypothetical protein